MKIVVVGLGQVGQELAKEMISKNHEVTVIDVNKNLVDNFTNKYEATGVVGSGASKEIQLTARCNIADIVVALTNIDEINLMTCLTAKHLGARYTIAKVMNMEYQNNDEFLLDKFKLDLVINSEHSTAEEITRIVGHPSNTKIEKFLDNKINMAEVTVRENSSLIGMTIDELEEKNKDRINIGCVVRDGKAIIPSNNTKFALNDIIYVFAPTIQLHKFLKRLKLIDKPIKSVLIVGISDISEKLILNLLNMNIEVKVIGFDLNRCQALSERFSEVMVVYGEKVESEILIEEGIKDFDACISLTGNDESNLVISLFAWSCGVRRIITKVSSISYTSMLHNVKIDSTLSPYSIILSSAIAYIRSIEDYENKSMQKLYRFAQNQAEAIEFDIDKDHDYCSQKLSSLNIKKDVLVTVIIRNRDIIMPNGETTFEKGDKVIIVSKSEVGISRIEDIFVE